MKVLAVILKVLGIIIMFVAVGNVLMNVNNDVFVIALALNTILFAFGFYLYLIMRRYVILSATAKKNNNQPKDYQGEGKFKSWR